MRSYRWLLVFVLVVALPWSLFAQAGETGLAFLKLGTSARGISMGDAMSAHARGSAATYYNPAGLRPGEEEGYPGEIMLMHKEWIQDTRTEFLGATVGLGPSQAIGLSINSTTVSDIEIRTRPGPADGIFTARNYALGLSYAHRFSEVLVAGLTGKFLYEKILVDDASGWGLDLGVQYRTPVRNLTAGAVVSNLGSMSGLRNEKSTLPTLLRVGGAYSGPFESMSSTWLLAADYQLYTGPGQSLVSVGGELVFRETLALRSGYIFGSEARSFSAGVGVRHGIIGFDYAFAPLSSDLGSGHTFSLYLSL